MVVTKLSQYVTRDSSRLLAPPQSSFNAPCDVTQAASVQITSCALSSEASKLRRGGHLQGSSVNLSPAFTLQSPLSIVPKIHATDVSFFLCLAPSGAAFELSVIMVALLH
jgi:hypothetical protein